QFARGKPHGFLRNIARHAIHLEEDASRLDLADPEFGRALARAHAHFGGLLGHRHVREDAYPDAARALHVAGEGAPRRLYLTRRDAFGLGRLQPKGAEGKRKPGLRVAMDAAFVLFAKV